MANKRSLKHAIHFISGNLLAESLSLMLNSDNHEDIEALLFSIVKTEDDYIRRISHPEPGMKPAVYFKHLREDFSEQTKELVDQIINLA